jgi:hypothetical protein
MVRVCDESVCVESINIFKASENTSRVFLFLVDLRIESTINGKALVANAGDTKV